ncbi:MAG: DUF2335 domain-containing protein [Acidobacteria bacterium]|nr:DUF2335 domain-containing protein [Acidobacteriota bacterium]
MSRRRPNRQPPKLPTKPAETEPAQPANRASEALERVSITQSFQGPLPPPGFLAKYNEAFSGCAERIVAMTEQQLTHRHALESRAIDGKLSAERRGQTLGFILALTAVIGGCVLIALGKDASGLTAIVTALAGLVAVFVYGRRKDAEERREKRSDFASPQLRLPYDEAMSEPNRSAHPSDHAASGRSP